MSNPFDLILTQIEEVKTILSTSSSQSPTKQIEIIDRAELCKRLDVSQPTVIRWERKGTIPCFRIGSNVRYNWHSVVSTLENLNAA